MKSFLNFTLMLALIVLTASCSKDDNFNAGWDDKSVETTITLDLQSTDDIDLGQVDIPANVEAYLDANNHDLESYRMLEVRPSSGSIISTSLLPLAFVESLDVYAVSDGSEQLIAMISSGSSQDPSLSLAGLDFNILDLSDETVQIVLRPDYNELAPIADDMEVEVDLTFVYSLSGRK